MSTRKLFENNTNNVEGEAFQTFQGHFYDKFWLLVFKILWNLRTRYDNQVRRQSCNTNCTHIHQIALLSSICITANRKKVLTFRQKALVVLFHLLSIPYNMVPYHVKPYHMVHMNHTWSEINSKHAIIPANFYEFCEFVCPWETMTIINLWFSSRHIAIIYKIWTISGQYLDHGWQGFIVWASIPILVTNATHSKIPTCITKKYQKYASQFV